MVFAGLGLGMGMPILNLAVQNEFEQKDLGAATASVQLFRGLGSTVGTALFSGILTAGILTSIGNPDDLAYIQTLRQAPESSQIISGDITADTLLQLNAQQQLIADGADQAFAQIPDPVAREAQQAEFSSLQTEFSDKVIDSFTTSLHHVFMVSSVLMVMALIAVSFIKERTLRSGVNSTPGE